MARPLDDHGPAGADLRDVDPVDGAGEGFELRQLYGWSRGGELVQPGTKKDSYVLAVAAIETRLARFVHRGVAVDP